MYKSSFFLLFVGWCKDPDPSKVMTDPDPGGLKTSARIHNTGTKFSSLMFHSNASNLCPWPTFWFTNIFITRQSTGTMMKEHISQDSSLMRSVWQYLIQGEGSDSIWIRVPYDCWNPDLDLGVKLGCCTWLKRLFATGTGRRCFEVQNPDQDPSFFERWFSVSHGVWNPLISTVLLCFLIHFRARSGSGLAKNYD